MHSYVYVSLLTSVCSLLSAGAITVIGDIRPTALDTVLDYAHDTQIPVILINNPADPSEVDDTRQSMQVYMEPSLTPTIVEMVNNIYTWERVYYIYDSLDAFPRIEQIHDTLHKMYFTPDVQPYAVSNAQSCVQLLMSIYVNNRGYDIRVILDIEPEKAKWVIDYVIQDKDIYKIRFHFMLPYLSMRAIHLESYHTGGVNITGFEILEDGKSMQYTRKNAKPVMVSGKLDVIIYRMIWLF
ncbi:glutamate receptor 1 [Plakobranchus ocellatus]|uniref:Glutamate receptor 1 n=1 Tax=Plakobranchus ocellatus TaxID=259542 RepID=A0AAV3YMY5_9GAST|nr:glutamate receptor 1 [Plakobranchus ocellatus]